ncbi:hypothetical protein [Kitasatospora herbaricolor]|uniref:hypothetical protein n=1 Tax=Kitasatospora herbaricolor TaxID=68217 RepID=UPI0036D90329
MTAEADNLLATPARNECLFSVARCSAPQEGPSTPREHLGTEPIRITANRNLHLEKPTYGPFLRFPSPGKSGT